MRLRHEKKMLLLGVLFWLVIVVVGWSVVAVFMRIVSDVVQFFA